MEKGLNLIILLIWNTAVASLKEYSSRCEVFTKDLSRWYLCSEGHSSMEIDVDDLLPFLSKRTRMYLNLCSVGRMLNFLNVTNTMYSERSVCTYAFTDECVDLLSDTSSFRKLIPSVDGLDVSELFNKILDNCSLSVYEVRRGLNFGGTRSLEVLEEGGRLLDVKRTLDYHNEVHAN